MVKKILQKKKLIITVFIILAFVLSFVYMIANAEPAPGATVQGIVPEKRDLTSTISATGMVESVNSRSVYSTQAYQINAVNVSVGDVVAEGDTLAQLDTTDLELKIQEQRASVGAQAAASSQQVAVAEHNLNNAKFTTDSGLNAQIISAQSNVDNAKYAIEVAEHEVKAARDAMDDNKGITGVTTPSEIYPEGVSGAGVPTNSGSYSQTGDGVQSTVTSQQRNAYEKAKLNQKNAEQQLVQAEQQLQAVLNSAGIDISTYEQSLKTARVSNNYSAQQIGIQSLEKNLADATVVSPISGTVTAVYAEEGGSGTGLLFVVEDTQSLQIETTVNEFDLLHVIPGMKVVVKTDATGTEEFSGVVSKVSPTAKKSEAGTNIATTNSQFGVTIEVPSGNEKLKIGMNAKVEMIADERFNVFAIPYDALQTDANGNNVIYYLSKNEEGMFIVKSKPVTIGLETDFYVEILDMEFGKDDIIVSTSEQLTEGEIVSVSNAQELGLIEVPEEKSNKSNEKSDVDTK